MNRRQFSIASFPVVAAWFQGHIASAAAPGREPLRPPPRRGVAAATLGGKQFWADQWHFHAWRIQRNVLTGHCRLLDGDNRRHASGTFQACRARMAAIRGARQLPPMQGEAVVVLHGLFRSRASMTRICHYLRDQGGYQVFNVSYPSTRGTVGDHARVLADVVDSLEGIERINLVAHSLGSLIIRHWLAGATDTTAGRAAGRRLGRLVMLGPPNQGAELAEKLIPFDLTRQLTGAAAQQLAHGWEQLAPQLATPRCEFGILAGGNRSGRGRNPLMTGNDDLIVTVESTQLAGARDFRVLPVWHMTMMNDPVVQEYTLRFLKHGYFESEEKRQPILGAAH